MSARIARPTFFEGQTLRAADLDLGVDYGRGQLARHERYLHTPGIATGLVLDLDKSTGVAQGRLSPGVAIDATGRQIVVTRTETLSPEVLTSKGVLVPADTDQAIKQEDRPWHPVFLIGRDELATPPSVGGGCGTTGAQPTRASELYEIDYGRPNDVPDPPAVAVSDGPEASDAVRVLVGFVQWDGANGFGDAKGIPKAGLSPAYAGARADEVVARGGALTLRADKSSTREKRPALVLDDAEGGQLRFGLQNAQGVVNPVFSVNSQGDLTVAGAIASPFSNDMWAESGLISDGMLVPLPKGVTQPQVDDGQVALHVVVTPLFVSELRPPGETGTWIREPFECRVDGRRVFARDRWFKTSNMAAAPVVVPTTCTYLVVASVVGRTS